MASTTLDKAIGRGMRRTSIAADFVSVFAWLGILLSVVAAPFTIGLSLLFLLVVPVEFAFARMVNEQVSQTELIKVMIRVQAGSLVNEPEATNAEEAKR